MERMSSESALPSSARVSLKELTVGFVCERFVVRVFDLQLSQADGLRDLTRRLKLHVVFRLLSKGVDLCRRRDLLVLLSELGSLALLLFSFRLGSLFQGLLLARSLGDLRFLQRALLPFELCEQLSFLPLLLSFLLGPLLGQCRLLGLVVFGLLVFLLLL